MKKVSRAQLAKAFVSLVNDKNQPDLLKGLAYELVSTHRASEMELMVRDINRELLRQQQLVGVAITAAHQLDATVMKQLEAQIKQLTGAKTIQATVVLDESLLGGLVAETPDDRWDLSLKHTLESLEI